MRTICKVIVQIGVLMMLSWVMNKLVAWLHIPVPGGIAGMVFLFLLLQAKVLRHEWLKDGAGWLIAELLLFFVSPAVGIVGYKQLLLSDGWQMALIIGAGTIVVMICSGSVAQMIAKRKERAGS